MSDSVENKPIKMPSKVRIAKSAYRKMWFTKIYKAITYFIVALMLVYLAFAVTVVRVLPTSELEFIPIKNNTFTGGIVPVGETIIVSLNEPQGTSMVDRLKQSFTLHSDVVVGEVIAGPYGYFSWTEPGIVTMDGVLIDGMLSIEPEVKMLSNQYLVKCESGVCNENELMIINKDNVFGVPLQDKESELTLQE